MIAGGITVCLPIHNPADKGRNVPLADLPHIQIFV
jgi:hypothetical protein